VVPVVDDQPSTVIAHSLSSSEYDAQFHKFSNGEGAGGNASMSHHSTHSNQGDVPMDPDNKRRSIEDLFGQSNADGNAASSSSTKHNSSSSQRRGGAGSSSSTGAAPERKDIERRMLVRSKTHIKHSFRDLDAKGQTLCKFVCTTYWATQFHAVRQAFLSSSDSSSNNKKNEFNEKSDSERSYIWSLSEAHSWAASGGKSGASFAKTGDGRFVVKCISRTELQMFLDCAPAYFEYLSKAFFHGLPTVLCKIVGVYQIGYHNRVTGKRTMEQVAVMQNIFYGRKISKTFDLKGSLRGRFAQNLEKDSGNANGRDESTEDADLKGVSTDQPNRNDLSSGSDSDDEHSAFSGSNQNNDEDSRMSNKQQKEDKDTTDTNNNAGGSKKKRSSSATLLDGDFLEFTGGRPLPLSDRAKAVFHMSILNDTLFLSIINVLDYSILVGIDEERMELVVGIIDFMRQYDILKQMERVGKSIPMVVGSEAPTIIQPPLYKARFTNAMERYFMTVPTKWTTI